ncbi:MAG: CCA tRNA nucleotidyltransferase [Acidobacteria bacterium]|nr:CCA tRNA nucleotidyltransferase [Acidobacteriota bacterium]
MADYIYLLENRLSTAQQHALTAIRDLARIKSLTVFLVGGAVRDLTSGSPVRDLDVVVQGNALKLKKDIEHIATVVGESVPGQAIFVRFPGGVRMEIGSTLSISYPKPGKAVAVAANILDDLRRRDFTANAMALSLNDGSYGLLMDPLNGVADIENRELRLVSNYGFIEDPIRMVRAIRLGARLGWQMDERTQARYETGKEEGYISASSDFQRGYEAEEIVHEEDPLRVLRRLESEGWMKFLAPAWTTAKVNVAELDKMRATQTQLQLQGIHPDQSAGNFPLLTAKMSSKDVAELKNSFPRQGFVAHIESLDREAKEFAAALSAKTAALPSQAWKLIHAAQPEAVLAVAYTTKSAPILAKFNSFYNEWPQARQKIPYALMQEMRITPELPGYAELVEALFFELMDGKLTTPEEIKAYLEPFSPPAPPPPVHLRRPRAVKKEAKPAKSRAKKAVAEAEVTDLAAQASVSAEGVTPAVTTSTSAGSSKKQPAAAKTPVAKEATAAAAAKKSAPQPAAAKAQPTKPAPTAKPVAKAATPALKAKPAPAKAPAKSAAKPAPKVASKSGAKAAAKPAAKAPAKAATKSITKGKQAAQPKAKVAVKTGAKSVAKTPAKAAKPAASKAKQPVKSKPAAKNQRPVAKKPAPKPAATKKAPAKVATAKKPEAKKAAAKPPVKAPAKKATPAAKVPAKAVAKKAGSKRR